MGGFLADPAGTYPGLFGSTQWMLGFPYALPNVVNAAFLTISAIALALGLEETLESLRNKPDYGIRLARWVGRTLLRFNPTQEYAPVSEQEGSVEEDVESNAVPKKSKEPTTRSKLPFRRIWTSNVLFTLLSHGLLACHVGTFNSLWFVFLSTPRYDPNSSQQNRRSPEAQLGHNGPIRVPENYQLHFPFTFTGGK